MAIVHLDLWSRWTKNTEKNRSLWNRQIRESTTKIETRFPLKIQTQIAQLLCRKASATRISGKDHWYQTAVTTFTENGPFQGYTRKTALFRATHIFQKVTKVVVNSQINVSFSLLNLKYYLTYQKKICLNKSFVWLWSFILQLTWMCKKKPYLLNFYRTGFAVIN